ncbi:DedA family protein [Nocardioides pyridinolyticus]
MDTHQASYGLLFLLLALEGTIVLGLFFPGVTVLGVAGYFAGTGELNAALAFFVAALGLLVGDNLTYSVGRFGLDRFRRLRQYVAPRRDRIERALRPRNVALYFFQFPMPTRVLVPVVAGVSRYAWARWIAIDVVASVLFVSCVGGAGYAVGAASAEMGIAIELGKYIQIAFAAILLIFVLVQIYKFVRRRKLGATGLEDD